LKINEIRCSALGTEEMFWQLEYPESCRWTHHHLDRNL